MPFAKSLLVKDIQSGSFDSDLSKLTDVNGTLFFSANNGFSGSELWKSDGTAAGTTLVQNIRSGNAGSFPASLTNVRGPLFFSADDGDSGRELWSTIKDGSLDYAPVANGTPDAYKMQVTDGVLEIIDGSGDVVSSRPLNFSTGVVITGEDGQDETLTIDFANGNPIPPGGMTFNGGSNGGIGVEYIQAIA